MQRTGVEHTASVRFAVCACVFLRVFDCDSSFKPILLSCSADSDSAAQRRTTGSGLGSAY